jgi:hypothetical protein
MFLMPVMPVMRVLAPFEPASLISSQLQQITIL